MDSVNMSHVALIAAQVVVFCIGCVMYVLQHSLHGRTNHVTTTFSDRIGEALRMAQQALQGVEMIDVEHYKTLARKHAELLTEVEALKVKVASLTESVESLSHKLASRARADAAIVRRAGIKAQNQAEDEPNDSLEDLIKSGVAVPLSGQVPPTQQMPLDPYSLGSLNRGRR